MGSCSNVSVESVTNSLSNASLRSYSTSDQGSFNIKLNGAEMGNVVTRFPPEPSGYLHIGHAKAVLLNEYFARLYKGKLIVRFDDTNPSKETGEYEQAIVEDLERLGVKADHFSHTSDFFDVLIDYSFKLIDAGLAYADDTPLEIMRQNRFSGLASARRENTVEENRSLFEEMIKGSEKGRQYCIRAKISIDANNKALRDPVIYRCQVGVNHHITGDKYKVYPTYDFACPIVDSLEGVTHALRSSEYHDRNDQYYWFIDALKLEKPFIWDYSRLNFVYTLLSKRKLGWFVANGLVSGWDDPRFPTVRGILRRGLTLNALKGYILMQGASKNTLLLEWDKLWALNKKDIDPISPRFTAIIDPVLLELFEDVDLIKKTNPLHPKNQEVGNKDVYYSKKLFIAHQDASDIQENEEITLMRWGNVIITEILQDNGKVVCLKGRLNLNGDIKSTKKKLTWLPCLNKNDLDLKDSQALNDCKQSIYPGLVPITFLDYDFLITKKKLEETDSIQDCLTETTEFKWYGFGESAMASLVKKTTILQIERDGFYICDEFIPGQSIKLIRIPDGKSKNNVKK